MYKIVKYIVIIIILFISNAFANNISDVDRILDDPELEIRGEFGTINEDGEYIPYDWRIRWLKRFPKVSTGFLVWLDEDEDFKYGPAIYLTIYTRFDVENKRYMTFEYATPKTFELGLGNQVAIAKIGWLILPIIDLKFDIGVVARFEDNTLVNGVSPIIGISLLRL